MKGCHRYIGLIKALLITRAVTLIVLSGLLGEAVAIGLRDNAWLIIAIISDIALYIMVTKLCIYTSKLPKKVSNKKH